jgi:hypothetical protein
LLHGTGLKKWDLKTEIPPQREVRAETDGVMRNKIVTTGLGMAVAGIILGLTVAVNAQGKAAGGAQAKDVTPSSQSAPGSIASTGLVPGFVGATTGSSVVLGWNYVHATSCQFYWDGANAWLYIFPSEGGYFYTAFTPWMNMLAPACQTGNWVGFYVTASGWTNAAAFSTK